MMRRWFRIFLIILAVLILCAAGFYYYLFHLHGLENIAASRLNHILEKIYPVEISIGHIGGNGLSELVLEDISVRFRDSVADYQVFGARRISAAYSIKSLWNANYTLKYLILDSAAVTLRRDSAGQLIIPPLPPAKDTSRAGGAPDFEIGNLVLNQCSFLLDGPHDTLAFDEGMFDGAIKSNQGTIALDIRQASVNSNRRQYRLPGVRGKLTYNSQQLVAQDLRVVRDSSQVKVSGTFDLSRKRGNLALNLDNVDVGEVGQLVGVKLSGYIDAYGNVSISPDTVRGTVSLGGKFLMAELRNLTTAFHLVNQRLSIDTIYGTALGNCELSGNARINFASKPETYSADLDIHGFDLKRMVPSAFSSDLNGHLHLDGKSFHDQDLVLGFTTDLYESTFDEYPIQRGSGKIIVTTDSVQFPEPFQVSYYENQFAVTGKVDYSRDIDLNVVAQLNNLDRYRGKLFIDQPGGRAVGKAHIHGETSWPDLTGYLTSDSLWLYGLYADSFDATFDIDRFLTGQQGSVVARGLFGSLYDHPYDSVFAVLGLDSNLVHMDSIEFFSPRATAFGKGVVDHGVYPQKIEVDTFQLQIFDQNLYNLGKIDFDLDSTGFNFTRSAIGSGGSVLMGLGRINFDETMNLALSATHVPIQTWARLYRDDFPSDGSASFQADVTGSFKDPAFVLRGSIDSLTYHELILGNVKYAGEYHNHQCRVDSVVVHSSTGVYTATGNFNADIDLTADTLARLIDQPIDITFRADDNRRDSTFSLVSLMLPDVELLDGNLAADFRLSGTPSSPHLEGMVSLKQGRLKYFDLADTLFTDSASATMENNQVKIDGLTAYLKDSRRPDGKSDVRIKGSITVKSLDNFNYDLEISIPKDVRIHYDLADIEAVVSGKLWVEGDTPPTVSGDLTVLSALYRDNFATADEGSPLMELLSGDKTWDLNINLEIISNYWIKNDDIDAEFSGLMNVIREKGNYRFIGQMDIIRGKGFLFDKTFNNLSGTISYDNINELNPTLDITGYTRIAGLNPNDSTTAATQEIGVRVTGTLENPDINTVAPTGSTDQTVYSREELLPLLLADYSPNSPTGGTREISKLGLRLQGVVGQQVSQLGTRELKRLIGVETFAVDPYYGDKLDPLKTSVTVGFSDPRLLGLYVPNLYVYGKSPLSGAKTGQEVGFEYRINRSVLLEGQRDQDQLYHLNLKLHWEF